MDFNPRPYERGDRPPRPRTAVHQYFNPRPYERGDDTPSFLDIMQSISIHAPTRGATRRRADEALATLISIHAPTRGATHHPIHQRQRLIFQSTPLREGRPCFRQDRARWSNFNPRPYERGDSKKVKESRYFYFIF